MRSTARSRLFTEAVDKPGAIDRMVTLPFGTLPGPVVLELLKFDLLVHCWDLATATGQPFDPPADTVEQGLQTAQMMISPELRKGPFAAEVKVGAEREADRTARRVHGSQRLSRALEAATATSAISEKLTVTGSR